MFQMVAIRDSRWPWDKWVWLKNRYIKWNPVKWKHGQKPAVPWWFNFDPYPNEPSVACVFVFALIWNPPKRVSRFRPPVAAGNKASLFGRKLSPTKRKRAQNWVSNAPGRCAVFFQPAPCCLGPQTGLQGACAKWGSPLESGASKVELGAFPYVSPHPTKKLRQLPSRALQFDKPRMARGRSAREARSKHRRPGVQFSGPCGQNCGDFCQHPSATRNLLTLHMLKTSGTSPQFSSRAPQIAQRSLSAI